jgi:hypothetical protein
MARLFRRHRSMIITLFVAAAAVVVSLIIFTQIRGG